MGNMDAGLPATSPTSSPFDQIRQVRAGGTEFWSARDLMPLLGYDKWERFADAVERAIVSMAAQGHSVDQEASRLREPSGRTNQMREDFHLSRFACYLVAMNGDPRKPEVAAAQSYFAIRTREAEVSAQTRAELVTRADLARMVLESEEEKAVLEAALESAAPAIAYHERHIAEDDDMVTVKTWGAQFGLTEPEAYQLLREKNIIYRYKIGERWSRKHGRKVEEFEHRARAGRITFGWFEPRPQHNAPRHHNGQVRQTLYVKQFFANQLAHKCGLTHQIAIDEVTKQIQAPTDDGSLGGEAA